MYNPNTRSDSLMSEITTLVASSEHAITWQDTLSLAEAIAHKATLLTDVCRREVRRLNHEGA